MEEDGFELAVPPRMERLWGATPGKHCRLGPEPVSGSAFRAAVSDWQRPEEPFAGAGPVVRIPFPPPESLRTFAKDILFGMNILTLAGFAVMGITLTLNRMGQAGKALSI